MLSRWLVALVLALLLPSYGVAALERPAASAVADIERVAALSDAMAAPATMPEPLPPAPLPTGDAETFADAVFDLVEACGPLTRPAAAPAAATAPRAAALAGLPSPDLAGPLRPPKFAA